MVDKNGKKKLTTKERMQIPRNPMPEQEPNDRICNFDEVPYGYTPELAMAEAERCIMCPKPKCISGCPVEVDIPAFIRMISEGDFVGAARKIKETNALPAICGRVCPQEEQCEAVCVLVKKYKPVAIGYLERFVANFEREHAEIRIPELPPSTGKKIAVVGSGPAGLTVAADLAQMGHKVIIFEALHKPGGVLIYGIPEFRLPKKVVAAEVDYLRKLGVEVNTSYVVGKLDTVDELFEMDFDAVFVGTGAGLPNFMRIEGENLNGVYSANEFLTRSNLMAAYDFPEHDTPIFVGKNVAVLGGGNTAMDSVRTSLRLGAQNGYIVYRRSRKEMPARIEEIHHAEQEGVQFHFLTNPVRYIGNDEGWVTDMECIKMELGEPDASGRRRPIPIEGSNFVIPVDTVVVAVGNSSNPLIPRTTPGLETNKWGNIVVNEKTMMSSRPGIFAGGDIVTGGATVILAAGAGKVAARAIHKYVMGIPFEEEKEEEKEEATRGT
ncbi:MAG: NADPH-dependent glutamate synthase [Candidatus Zixiibacteriota bacterium]|nr:MAG: NADPH-dependent glutamate synthase [candidate division Zixibacteria bacterium]